MSQGASLQAKLSQRDQLLHVLQEETGQLLTRHSLAMKEVSLDNNNTISL